MRRMSPLRLTTLVAGVACLPTVGATAQDDVEGSSDHPLVSRYEGSAIYAYDVREFDEYELLTGRVGGDGPTSSEHLEGKVTRISYHLPGTDRSTLEVFRNYENELGAAGFETLFSCTNADCGGRAFNHTAVPYMHGFAENYEDQRFLAARRSTASGDVALSLYVCRNHSSGGPTRNHVYYRLDIIEAEPMDVGMVTVDAETMAKEILETGSVSIYGIHFDTDRTDIRPESEPTLDEIVKLLDADANLSLYVVGHTDNVGARDYNMDLSRRRAHAVADALAAKGVDRSRLEPDGVGPLAPVAPNESEAGRALNRRVELVKR